MLSGNIDEGGEGDLRLTISESLGPKAVSAAIAKVARQALAEAARCADGRRVADGRGDGAKPAEQAVSAAQQEL